VLSFVVLSIGSMPTRFRKSRGLRGHVTMGYGRVGKHRKHPGGRGNAGGLHHLRSWFSRYHPGHFGKLGMRHRHLIKNQKHCPTINVDHLWGLLPEIEYFKQALSKGKTTKVPMLDVTKYGYFKVTGKGRLPKLPLVVKARSFTSGAEQKIKAVGGHCLLCA